MSSVKDRSHYPRVVCTALEVTLLSRGNNLIMNMMSSEIYNYRTSKIIKAYRPGTG